jgi:hypothetical protein
VPRQAVNASPDALERPAGDTKVELASGEASFQRLLVSEEAELRPRGAGQPSFGSHADVWA